MADSHVLGIDLGGTKLSAAVVSAAGEVTCRFKEPISKENTLDQIAEAARASIESAGVPVKAIGVCVPGIYFPDSGNAWAPNLWGTGEVPLRAELAARLPAPVTIDSDRAACVLGEQWLGAAAGCTNVVFLAIGTGIGAGILIDGRVCRGAHGIAGAVGWFALDPRYRDEYRAVGCFEAEAAGPALARRFGSGRAEDAVQAARAGDSWAHAVADKTAAYIAMGVANLVSAFDPEMIVLGGGVAQGAGDLLLEAVRRGMLDWAQPVAARCVRIELTRLGEDAGLLGAARLALLNPAS